MVQTEIGQGGEVLIIHNVTRNCGDTYECRVDNGVPPAVSKAIHVNVEFPPEVVVPRPMRIGQVAGKETILECTIYAEPQGMTAWRRDGQILRDGPKYEADMMEDVVNKAVILTLRIRELEPEDFGYYQCTGSNYLGSDQENMLVYRIEPPPTPSTTTTTTTVPVPVIHGGRDNNVAYNGKNTDRWTVRGRQNGDSRNRYEDPHHDTDQSESNYYDKQKMDRQGKSPSSHQEGKTSRSKGNDDTWSVFGPKDASSRWTPQTWVLVSVTALSFFASCLYF
ncbi:MAM domain-containing glycosylphosphatidylinositol anchor protein 1 [Elysia marginata]|uniref:MAM domain-containing glycosylphosphatidylinositol anchor protein 1 n=1 Tax=Elysia marginata TaxID=1093978 RepID=A0AAV4J993_9GAST|nr:MAM domain-containing glycosylphosphatidylinositol anchor protein 1 [Elysia marginata]